MTSKIEALQAELAGLKADEAKVNSAEASKFVKVLIEKFTTLKVSESGKSKGKTFRNINWNALAGAEVEGYDVRSAYNSIVIEKL
jgi:hypothetical protein